MSVEQTAAEELDKATPETMPAPATEKEKSPKALNLNVAFVETAGLLLIWSICVTIEGGIRFNDVDPSIDLSLDQFPSGLDRRVLFVGGLFEVIFGLMGLCIAVATLVFKWFNAAAIKVALLIQFVLGVYVFATFVIVFPIYRASITGTPGIVKWAISLGLLTSVHFCYALQGGQFLLMARLISTATGDDFMKGKSGHTMRALFWNANWAMAGMWTFMFGITAISSHNELGLGPDGFFAFPPHVGEASGLSLATGIVMMMAGFTGMFLAIKPGGDGSRNIYYMLCGLVFLLAYLNFTIAQFGLNPETGGGGIAMHTGLVFVTAFLGPYFLHKSTRKHSEDRL